MVAEEARRGCQREGGRSKTERFLKLVPPLARIRQTPPEKSKQWLLVAREEYGKASVDPSEGELISRQKGGSPKGAAAVFGCGLAAIVHGGAWCLRLRTNATAVLHMLPAGLAILGNAVERWKSSLGLVDIGEFAGVAAKKGMFHKE